MTFQKAALKAAEVTTEHVKVGLSALEGVDRPRISAANPRVFTASLNLDEALKSSQPNASRWDYGIGLKKTAQSESAIWVEVHPASTGEVKTMIKKFQWLKRWLQTEAKELSALTKKTSAVAQFNWVASGRVSIPKTSRQAKLLAQSGLPYPVKHLKIP